MRNLLSNKGAVLLGIGLLLLMALSLTPAVLTGFRAQSFVNYDSGLAARWQAMADYYAKRQSAQVQRADAALSARWQAMGEYYRAQAAIHRGSDASAARWQGLGAYHLRRQADAIQQGRAADAARWQAMSDYYANVQAR